MSLSKESVAFHDQIIISRVEQGGKIKLTDRLVNWSESVVSWKGRKVTVIRTGARKSTFRIEKREGNVDHRAASYFPVTFLIALLVKSVFRLFNLFYKKLRGVNGTNEVFSTVSTPASFTPSLPDLNPSPSPAPAPSDTIQYEVKPKAFEAPAGTEELPEPELPFDPTYFESFFADPEIVEKTPTVFLTDNLHGNLVEKNVAKIKSDFFSMLRKLENNQLRPQGYRGASDEEVRKLNHLFRKYISHIFTFIIDRIENPHEKIERALALAAACSGHCSARLKSQMVTMYGELYGRHTVNLEANDLDRVVLNRLQVFRNSLFNRVINEIVTGSVHNDYARGESSVQQNYYRSKLGEELGLGGNNLITETHAKWDRYIEYGREDQIRLFFKDNYTKKKIVVEVADLLNLIHKKDDPIDKSIVYNRIKGTSDSILEMIDQEMDDDCNVKINGFTNKASEYLLKENGII